MAKFKYVAMDSKGRETEGMVEAENQAGALDIIKEKGFFPTRVEELGAKRRAAATGAEPGAKKGLGGRELRIPGLGGRVRPKQLTIFTRQLATLIDAGLPLLRGLNILLKQERNVALRRAIGQMAEGVEGGNTFAEALSHQPKIFNKLFVNMVRAGEVGGVLHLVLDRLAEYMEKAQRIKNKVRSAMVYPAVVIVVAVVVVSVLFVFIIPNFQRIFKDLLGEQGLPALTRGVLAVSETLKNHGLYVIVGIIGVVILFRLVGMTRGGRYVYDWIKLRSPIFGQLVTKVNISRFSRTLGTLMSSGVPVLQALTIVRDTVGNEVLGRAIMKVHDSIKEGDTMARPLEAAGIFPGMVVSMIDVGEETGALPQMLVKIADTYDDEVDSAVEAITSIIEPVLIIFLALIVGTIVISMFMPLIAIIGKLGQ
ncbi:MAG: type II secretion system F family protein [Kiritimatiellae bacterium]|nr:type II secretion system F family protein [Kiritimatiellia bacterium]